MEVADEGVRWTLSFDEERERAEGEREELHFGEQEWTYPALRVSLGLNQC